MKIQRGFTLIELMIAIAILAIITAIAIPAYQTYITEAKLSTARSNMDSIRIFLEDRRLETGSYIGPSTHTTLTTIPQITSVFGWEADGNKGSYSYRLELTDDLYNIAVSDGDIWIRCENRMNKCCDSEITNTTPSSACP